MVANHGDGGTGADGRAAAVDGVCAASTGTDCVSSTWTCSTCSTAPRVRTIAAIMVGDVIYNQVHMMTAETDEQSRQVWMDNPDRIAAMKPHVAVASHKRVGMSNGPENISESKRYLADFPRVVNEHDRVEAIVTFSVKAYGAAGDGVVNEHDRVEAIVTAMLTLYSNRDNPRVVWHSARQAVAERA